MPMFPVFFVSYMLHALVAWSLASDLGAVAAPLELATWLLLSCSAALLPMGVLAQRFSKPPFDAVLTWVGLLCMGYFSSLLVLTLVRTVLLGLAGIALWLDLLVVDMPLVHMQSAVAVPTLSLVLTVLGFWNARRTATVVHIDLPIDKLPEALQGFSIAQISDIHVGPTIKTDYLQRIVNKVNGLQVDLVAITGDLVDGSVRELQEHVAVLANLQSRYGSFFVTGNHEYYSGAHGWIEAVRGLGVQVLMNEHVVLHHNTDSQDPERAVVVVAGVTDFTAHHFDPSHQSDPHQALVGAPAKAHVRLLLAHQPRSANAAALAGFDVQLSGHTHGGQFWPWMHFVRWQQPFTAGLHKLEKLWVYTSRGTGYWGPPKRFGAPSEITCLRLVRA